MIIPPVDVPSGKVPNKQARGRSCSNHSYPPTRTAWALAEMVQACASSSFPHKHEKSQPSISVNHDEARAAQRASIADMMSAGPRHALRHQPCCPLTTPRTKTAIEPSPAARPCTVWTPTRRTGHICLNTIHRGDPAGSGVQLAAPPAAHQRQASSGSAPATAL